MATTEAEILKEIRFAEEGLEQMQAPGAGYEDDPEKLERDVKEQCKAIDRLNNKLARVREGK